MGLFFPLAQILSVTTNVVAVNENVGKYILTAKFKISVFPEKNYREIVS